MRLLFWHDPSRHPSHGWRLGSLAAVAWLFGLALALAGPETFVFGRDAFAREPASALASAEDIEFGLAGESAQNWTKLLSFHLFRHRELPLFATLFAENVRQQYNRPANLTALGNGAKEILLDFQVLRPQNVMELNVFKFSTDGDGIVAAQYVVRLASGSLDPEAIKAIRSEALAAMTAFDMGPAKTLFPSP